MADSIYVFETLLTGNGTKVYADSAYKSVKHYEILKKKGVRNRILERAYRNKPLTNSQRFTNKTNSGVRSIFERAFRVLKLHLGMRKAGHSELSRNNTHLGLLSLAYNIKRGFFI